MLPGVYSVDERKYTILSTVVVRKSGTVEGEMPMEKKLFCDVLVIGGGVAGMRAAVAAQHSGASVVLAVKGNIGACGASAYTVTEASGYGVADGRLCPQDSPDRHYEDIIQAGRGMCDEEVVRTLVENAPGTIAELEAMGVAFEKRDGNYLISQGCFGSLSRNYNLRGHGTKIIHRLQAALDERTTVLEDVMITDLFTENGRCMGAAALGREGETTCIFANAVVMAGGGAGGLFRFALSPPEMTGDSYALGYLAGARLMNMEFMQVGMGILAPGKSILNSWLWSLHPKVTDKKGNSVFPEVFADGVTVREAMDAKAVHYPFSSRSSSKHIEISMQKAIAKGLECGHGGLLMDVQSALKENAEWASLSEIKQPVRKEKLQLFEDMWKLTNDWYLSKGIDVRNGPVEITCFAHAMNGGLKIDAKARTSLPGLYAAGEAASGPHGADRLGGNMLVTCVVYGKIAGECAAKEALSLKKKEEVEYPTGRSLWKVKYEPLKREGSGRPAREIMEEIRLHMSNDLLVIRSEEKGIHLKKQLERLKTEAERASYETGDIWAPYELRNMLLTAHMIADAAMARKESRGSHYREDYPEENPGLERPYIIQRQEN